MLCIANGEICPQGKEIQFIYFLFVATTQAGQIIAGIYLELSFNPEIRATLATGSTSGIQFHWQFEWNKDINFHKFYNNCMRWFAFIDRYFNKRNCSQRVLRKWFFCDLFCELCLNIFIFVLFSASALIHLCKSRDEETKRLALQTLELLAIEKPEFVIERVSNFLLLCTFYHTFGQSIYADTDMNIVQSSFLGILFENLVNTQNKLSKQQVTA